MNLENEKQIETFVKELMAHSAPWQAMKLVTLGHGRIGKTTLLNKLRLIVDPNEKVAVCMRRGMGVIIDQEIFVKFYLL
jgi:Flp pilus assembly CpaF family ATPase